MKKLSFKILSIRLRLTILFVFIFGSTMILFSTFFYYKFNESLLQDFDDALYNYSIDISQTIDIGPKNDLNFPPLTVDEGKIFPFPSGTALILVRHAKGKILVKNGPFGDFIPPYKKEVAQILSGEEAAYTTISDAVNIPSAEAGTYRVITFPLDSETKPTLFLQIAVPMVSFETQLAQLKNILTFGLPAILLIALVAGLFFASRALRPIQELITFTNRINANDLHQRIPIPEAQDEIQILSNTVNQMLDRIEKAFASQERFVADASHQLLTPLTILKGEIEVHQKLNESETTQSIFRSLLQEVDNLSKIVKDMLLLARIDAGAGFLQMSDFFLDEVLIDVVSRLQKMANSKKIQIKVDFINHENRKTLKGDADLISNLITNLIENAVKYSYENSQIYILINWSETTSNLAIEDFGVGVKEDQISELFNRFSRGNTSSDSKGFGLGLAIAQKIANLHNTKIEIQTKDSPGLLVKVSFA